MNELLLKTREALEQLRHCLACDLSAVARFDRRNNRIKYEVVSGEITNRLTQMIIKPGSGVAGQVIRYGRPYILDASSPNLDKERNANPAMLAERLYSVMAVPLYQEEQINGVLMVGKRENHRFSEEELAQLIELASKIRHNE